MAFLVSAGRFPKQLGDLSHITFSGYAKWKNSPQVESQLEALELLYLLNCVEECFYESNFWLHDILRLLLPS
jgi:hypothetical protein